MSSGKKSDLSDDLDWNDCVRDLTVLTDDLESLGIQVGPAEYRAGVTFENSCDPAAGVIDPPTYDGPTDPFVPSVAYK